MRRSLGKFSKRTRALRKRARKRSLTMQRVLSSFKTGDKVCVDPAPSQEGLPHPRYRGRHAVVLGMRGKYYVIEVRTGKARKKLIIHGMHLRR